jgi:hypothetical protein
MYIYIYIYMILLSIACKVRTVEIMILARVDGRLDSFLIVVSYQSKLPGLSGTNEYIHIEMVVM